MQKTFRLDINGFGFKYLVKINKNKKVNITTGTEEINFFFGNSKYINAEKEYLFNFLSARLCKVRTQKVLTYILTNVNA
jgi:hypothetical protein